VICIDIWIIFQKYTHLFGFYSVKMNFFNELLSEMNTFSIQKPKQPQRYFFLEANFDVIGGDVSVF
jgi:hypothetical protein